MFDALTSYPCYVDSNVPWAGSIPQHWKVRRGKVLFAQSRLPAQDGDEIVTCFRDGQVTLRRNRRAGGFMIALQEVGYQGVRRGQLVIHAMDVSHGGVGTSDSDGKCTPEYIVCNPRDIESVPGYYAHALRLAAHSGFILVACPAVRERAPRLRYPDFGEMLLPVPPPDEQAAIVRFLEVADRRIRHYIRARQKLLSLLEEQKRAVVHRAVIGRLNPNRTFKPSGVDWIGEIPEGWEVKRLKALVSRTTSGSRGWASFAADSGPLFLRIGNLTRGGIDLDLTDTIRLKLPNSALVEAARTRVQPNDILVSITAYIGSVGLIPPNIGEAYISQHVACCRPRLGSADPRWIGYVLLSPIGQTHGQLSMYGGTKQGLSLDDVRNYVVVVPPLDEQVQLVNWIEGATANLDAAMASTRREIGLLREWRTRLLADVVTGKLDVRTAAASLPDDPSETLSPDDAEDDDDDSEGDVSEDDP